MDIAAQMADALKKARQDKGLSQRALAKRTGMAQSHISKIEAGTTNIRMSSLAELAHALDLDVVIVPKRRVRAVHALLAADTGTNRQRPAYRLDPVGDTGTGGTGDAGQS